MAKHRKDRREGQLDLVDVLSALNVFPTDAEPAFEHAPVAWSPPDSQVGVMGGQYGPTTFYGTAVS